ncbi:MAG: hypothetical protein WDN03_16505 [Rhizomicrobium sp.]
MTTAESFSADFAQIQAAHMQAEAASRRRTVRRTLAALAVLLVHVIGVAVFMYSNQIPIMQRLRQTIPEAIMWIPMPKKPAPLNPRLIEPQPPAEELPLPILPAPITLPPVRRSPLPPPPSEGLEGVGRSLACGAGSFENLPPAMRDQCRRHPWAFVKRPDGTIVMEAPPKPVDVPTTADIMRHEQQTAPPCPVLQNVPCLGKVMHGDPLGGGPQPF